MTQAGRVDEHNLDKNISHHMMSLFEGKKSIK